MNIGIYGSGMLAKQMYKFANNDLIDLGKNNKVFYCNLSSEAKENDIIIHANQIEQSGMENNIAHLDKLIKEIEDYKGLLLIASEQTETLCHYAAVNSKINPFKIMGINGIKRDLFSSMSNQKYNSYGEIITAGFDYDPVILEKSNIDNKKIDEEIRQILEYRSDKFKKSLDSEDLEKMVSFKTYKTINAILGNNAKVNVSIPVYINNSFRYLGVPVRFKDMKAECKYDFSESDIEKLKSSSMLHDRIYLRNHGIFKQIEIPIEHLAKENLTYIRNESERSREVMELEIEITKEQIKLKEEEIKITKEKIEVVKEEVRKNIKVLKENYSLDLSHLSLV